MDGEEKNNNFEDLNIFNEITKNADITNDTDKIKEKKDLYDYLSFYTKTFKLISYILLLIMMLSSTYVYIQKSESFYEHPYLNLLCPLFL
jgi:hypothetical protein